MNIRNIEIQDKTSFNRLALHPLQSWEWGEFRRKTGIEVIRLGKFDSAKLIESAQLTIHPLPFTSWTIGYLPKGRIPSREMLEELIKIGKQYRCIFIKLEPNIEKDTEILRYDDIKNNKEITPNIRLSPHPLFTKYTFHLNLTKSEGALLATMHPKTRYNIRIAQKHGVEIKEDSSGVAFNTYLQLLIETTKRQKFYAHDKKYHQLMWETLKPSGIAHLLTANYKYAGKTYILVAWIVLLFNNILYYPYGASSSHFKNVMASNLMMWEAIRFGKKHGAEIFDMWGALGPTPNPTDPWYGFHRFKQGYGTKLVEFVGSFDLVINPPLYRLYNHIHTLRQFFLKIKSNF